LAARATSLASRKSSWARTRFPRTAMLTPTFCGPSHRIQGIVGPACQREVAEGRLFVRTQQPSSSQARRASFVVEAALCDCHPLARQCPYLVAAEFPQRPGFWHVRRRVRSRAAHRQADDKPPAPCRHSWT
jgi:hypothetical protein